MPQFAYVALDSRGQESTGFVEAVSTSDAIVQLRQAGYFPTGVYEEGQGVAPEKKSRRRTKTVRIAPRTERKRTILFQKRTVKAKTLMVFTRQLATLIDAGLPLLRGLNVLAKQERDVFLKNTINQVADSVQGGSTFSESLALHPKIFNKLFINMVKAGELGGVLELVLGRLAEFQEKAQKVKNKVKSAMIYPVIVLSLAMIIMAFLFVFIVPRFESIFHDMLGDKPLPAITQSVIGISGFMQHHWRMVIDRVALRAPLFGDLTRKNSISRFARTLGTLVTSGVPILQALNITRETAGNTVIANAISRVHDSVKEGESIVQPLDASGAFPPMVISMVDVGEETGQLPEMLLKIAEVYDDEVDNSVAGLTSMLEPIMIVMLAVIVGTIVIALFMPLISIIGGLQAQN
jgi:type IV pilus assembly protein PilC